MDPVSAGIASVGLAASLVTLTALCSESCQRLWALNHNLRNAPEELQRLRASVALLKTLLDNFRNQVQQGNNDTFPGTVVAVWTHSVRQMDLDIQPFDALVAKLSIKSTSNLSKRMGIRARLRKVVADGKLADWERTLNTHIQHFTLFHSMMANARLEEASLNRILTQSIERCLHAGGFCQQAISPEPPARQARPASNRMSLKTFESPSPWLSLDMPTPGTRDFRRSLSTPRPLDEARLPRPAEHTRVLFMNYNSFRLPVGVFSFEKKGRVVIKDLEEDHEQLWTFTFVPKPWLAVRLVQVRLLLLSNPYAPPTMRLYTSMTRFNRDPSLSRYVFMCNKSGLQRLFKQGKANPKDFLVTLGRPMIQEAIFAYNMKIDGALDMVSFLLSEGADPNSRDVNGYTSLLLCCKLMFNISRGPNRHLVFGHMFPLFQLLLSSGADPTLCGGPQALSTFSTFFYESAPLDHIRDIMRQYIDASNFDDLLKFDSWILACLIRDNSRFCHDLESELAEFHTTPQLSTSKRIAPRILDDWGSTTTQIQQLREADPAERIRFLRGLCRVGTPEMAAPFFKAGILVSEADNTRLSYLGEAVDHGNLGVMTVLLNAGARVEAGLFMDSPQVLLARWDKHEERNLAKEELHLMEELIKVSRISVGKMPTVLLNSLRLNDNNNCFNMLLKRGFGLCTLPADHEDRVRSRWKGRQHTSNAQGGGGWFEVIEAVYRDNFLALQALIDRGATVEDEDDAGCTALIAAIDLGRVESVGELVNHGHALLETPSGCGFTPWDLCSRNLLERHPRPLNFNHRITITDGLSITMEADLQIYSIIRRARKRRRGVTSPSTRSCWAQSLSPMSSFTFSRAFLGSVGYAQAEVVFQYMAMNRFLGNLTPGDILLGALGFCVTVLALGCYAAWEFGWRVTLRLRRFSLAVRVSAMVVLAMSVVFRARLVSEMAVIVSFQSQGPRTDKAKGRVAHV